jgi:hypothetical protein
LAAFLRNLSLRLTQYRFDLLSQHWKLGLYDIPNDPIIHIGVAVNQNIAERHSAAVCRKGISWLQAA